MGVRDRFFTPRTAQAILSWRIGVGVAVAIATAVAGLPLGVAIGVGAGVYAGTVWAAMPSGPRRPAIDPFVLSEPWRRLVHQAQRADRRLRETVAATPDGPIRDRLTSIADQLDHGLDAVWQIARRGDEIDHAVRHLDPTALSSKLATLRARAVERPSADTDAAIRSVEAQLASADRLKRRSAETADQLRLTQTRLDELVARASEVRIGVTDTDSYASEVDDLVVQLEALHAAVAETEPGAAGP